MDIAADGTIYITGYDHAVTVSPSGKVTGIIQNLQYSPTFWVITPDGSVYIKDISLGVLQYDPAAGSLTKLNMYVDVGVADFLALSYHEFLFTAAGADNSVFLA